MADRKIYDNPSDVNAKDGSIEQIGPDDVDVSLTPDAAEQTADRLHEQSVIARGQQRLSKLTQRPRSD